MLATTSTNRYVCQLTGGSNDSCTHAWFDATPDDLRAELTRLKDVFDKAMATKKGQKFYDRKWYIGNTFFADYNIDLKCGEANYDPVNPETDVRNQWDTFPLDPAKNSDDPGEWDDTIDDYALRLTKDGVYFIVESSWDDDSELDETPVLPWNFIQ